MREFFLAPVCLLALSGCATYNAVSTGKPIDPVQVQQDLVIAKAALQTAGCAASLASTAAAPIIAVTVDDQGQKVAQAVGASGAVLCQAPAAVAAPAGTVLVQAPAQ